MNIISRRLLCRGQSWSCIRIFQQIESEIVAKYDIIVPRVCSVHYAYNVCTSHANFMFANPSTMS
jgi:hypothetical protein